MKHTLTKADLWKKQLELWPDSIELSNADMKAWAMQAKSDKEIEHRFAKLGFLADVEPKVYYKTNQFNGYIGCRVGIEDGDYHSNY